MSARILGLGAATFALIVIAVALLLLIVVMFNTEQRGLVIFGSVIVFAVIFIALAVTPKKSSAAEDEAVESVKIDDKGEDGKILDVVQVGYELNGKEIRPPKVKVGHLE